MENISKLKQWALGVSVAAMLGLGWACTDDDAPENWAPGFSNYSAYDTKRSSTKFSASLTGAVDLVKEYGFQYSTSSEFPTDQTKSVKVGEGAPVGSFIADVTGLERSKVYYFRVYASTGATTVYSEYDVFTTPSASIPNMSNTRVVEIGENSAKISFKLDDIGDEHLIECGVGYVKGTTSTSYTPVVATLEDSVYVADITDLEANTTYSFRPYAKNGPKADGTEGVIEGYGDIVQGKTDELMAPEVITEFETSSGISSITVSGMVESAIGSNGVLFDCGFVYSSESKKPRLELNHPSVSMPAPEELGEHFVADITGLMANTTYYVCAYARNEVNGELKVGYGEPVSVTTGTLMKPNINIDSFEPPTASSIIMQATIANYDKGALKEKGFIYDRSSSEITWKEAVEKDQIVRTLGGSNVYTDTISGLEMNTSYMVKAYAIYEAEGVEPAIGYSAVLEIYTSDFQLPSISVDVKNITRTTADLTGKFYNKGNGEIIEKGFLLLDASVAYNPTFKNKGIIHIVADDNFAAVAKDLQKETSYSFNSYAISRLESKVDTVYSDNYGSFQTTSLVAPAFVNVQLDDATYNSFKATCGITEAGDGKLLEKGFYYKKDNADFSSERDSIIVNSEAYDEFSTIITGSFNYYSNYYVTAYAKKEIDGEQVIFTSSNWSNIWIPGPSTTEFGDFSADSTTYHSFVASAKINNLGDGTLLEKGFFWKTGGYDFENGVDSLIVESGTNEEFSAKITGLSPSTWYYWGVYTKMDLGGEIVINRSGGSSIWILNLDAVSYNYFNLNGLYKAFNASVKINLQDADAEITEKGFCWRKVGDNDWDSPTLEKNDGIYKFEGGDSIYTTVNNLEVDKEYYVRAYAKLKLHEGEYISYSETNWTSMSSPSMPTFEYWSWDVRDHTRNSFKVKNYLASKGNVTIANRGYVVSLYNKNSEPTIENCDLKYDDVDETFEKTITGLLPGTEYAVRGFLVAKWDEESDTIYNDRILSVWTNSIKLPTFNTVRFSDQGLSQLTVTSGIKEIGDGTLKEKGFCWDRSTSDFTLETETTKKQAVTTDSLKLTLTDLDFNTRYYVRAYAKVEVDGIEYVAYSDQNNARTSSYSYPSMSNAEINGDLTTYKSASLSCVLHGSGNGVITEKGFVLSKCTTGNYEPTLENCAVKVVADDEFTATVTDLDWNTEYAVRGYVTSKWEETGQVTTEYSGWRTCFWTKNIDNPSFNNVQVDSISYSSIVASSGIISMGDGEFVEKGFIWIDCKNDYWREPTKDNYVGMAKVVSEENESYILKIDSLMPNTPYRVRAYVKLTVDGKEGIAYSSSNYFNTSSLNANINWIPQVTSCDFTAEFTEEASNIKNVYVYLTTNSNEQDLSNWTKYTMNQDETTLAFSKTIEGLDQNTTYYLKVYYEFAGNLIEYTNTSFTTRRVPQSGDNVSPGMKGDE